MQLVDEQLIQLKQQHSDEVVDDIKTVLLRGLSEEQLNSIAVECEHLNLPLEIYIHLSVVSAKLDTCKRSGLMNSKDFHRGIDSIKKKADYIANLTNQTIVVPIPIPLADIQAILYHRLKGLNISHDENTSIFNIVFNVNKHKGNYKRIMEDNNNIIVSMTNVLNSSGNPHDAIRYRYDKTYVAFPK